MHYVSKLDTIREELEEIQEREADDLKKQIARYYLLSRNSCEKCASMCGTSYTYLLAMTSKCSTCEAISHLVSEFENKFSPVDLSKPFYGIQEAINHPWHYQSRKGLEVIDVIRAFDCCFITGNVIKYVLRAGKKGDELEDLRKAKWYLERAILELESQ